MVTPRGPLNGTVHAPAACVLPFRVVHSCPGRPV